MPIHFSNPLRKKNRLIKIGSKVNCDSSVDTMDTFDCGESFVSTTKEMRVKSPRKRVQVYPKPNTVELDYMVALYMELRQTGCCPISSMDPLNLQDDIIEFLEEKAPSSKTFAAILECTEVYMDTPVRYPKASSAAIAKLPFTRIYPHDRVKYAKCDDTCSLCSKRLMDGVALSRMPCGHIFHINCVVSWLGQSCACPVCHYEIETKDPLYEIGRRQRMAGRSTCVCECKSYETHRCVFPILENDSAPLLVPVANTSTPNKVCSSPNKKSASAA